MVTSADIIDFPLSDKAVRAKVSDFLQSNGLRLEAVDRYVGLASDDGSVLAGGGICGDVIKCLAVSEELRSEGAAAMVVSRLVSIASENSVESLKVFTKPEYEDLFKGLGFRLIGKAPKAVLLEGGRGLERYLAYLKSLRREGSGAVIIMNANPFTKGHEYLIGKALSFADNVYVIVVRRDGQRFSYAERLAMVRSAEALSSADKHVIVCQGSDYQISETTFPSYFLKDLSEASETQMRLDLDVFSRHIAPALGAAVRVVGSEPSDSLTARYNELMKELLPGRGVKVCEVERLMNDDTQHRPGPVCASSVRGKLQVFGGFADALSLVPSSTVPYILADRAVWALRTELELPLKPGLVCPSSRGAHTDMDYAVMSRSIDALRPWFDRFAILGHSASLPDAALLKEAGLEAEKAMLDATGGVNTHKGAIFSMGLALAAVASGLYCGNSTPEHFSDVVSSLAQALPQTALSSSRKGVCDAITMARGGYSVMFRDWIPYMNRLMTELMDNPSTGSLEPAPEPAGAPAFARALQMTLLRIMSALDDTCIIRRAGTEKAAQVKKEAALLLQDFDTYKLKEMNERYCAERVSPGGSADMLALTLFTGSIFINQ